MQALQQQLQQLQQQMQQDPQAMQQMQQNPQMQEIQKTMQEETQKMEARKAVLISEFMVEFAEAEKEVLNTIESQRQSKKRRRGRR